MSDLIPAGQAEAAPASGPASPADPAQPAPTPAPHTPAPSMAETIRQARQEREARAQATSKVEALERELAEARSAPSRDPLKDPVGWAKAQKMSPEAQSEFAQALLYDLVPDKAPPDFRVKFLESRMAREEAARTKAAEEAKAQAAREAEAQSVRDYGAMVTVAAKSFNAGSHPESEAWFGDDADSYAKSLLATASNLAEVAQRTGKVANLDVGHVAGVLEQEIARRMTARDARRAGAPPKVDPAQTGGDGGVQTAPDKAGAISTRGLNTGGPRPPAATAKERIARAVAAAFPTK